MVATRGAPYHSYQHQVERVMSVLNLALYGFASERPLIDPVLYPGMEAMWRKARTTSEIRAAAERYPMLKEGALAAVGKVHAVLIGRFTKFSLKGIAF